MAEIGLVAAIFGVASFGTKVATSLYGAADDMIHADQQITSMAKHVSQFTAVLRHLGRVLESEQGNCSNDLLHEIRKIKHSCKATFKEINATIRSRRLRPFVPVRWLFKKSKAKELEARLDSQQSILQVMIHTVTVAKLGDMQSKSKEDSKQITGLREEIDLLKTLIIENYNNATLLQRAEQRAEAEAGHYSFPAYDIHRPQPPYDFQEPPQHDRLTRPNMNDIPPPRSLSAGSSLSEPENEDRGPDKTAGSTRDIPPRNQSHPEYADSSDDDAHPTNTYQESALQSQPEYKGVFDSAKTRTSTLLLEMVPFEPGTSDTAYYHRSNYLISAGPSEPARLSTNPKPAMEEATKSVRLLLDKWTNSGSAPIASLLLEESAKHPPDEELADRNRRREPGFSPSPPSPLMGNMSDDEVYSPFYPPPVDPFPYTPGGYMPPPPPHRPWHSMPKPAPWVPPFGISHMRTKDVWKPFHAYGQVPSSYIGADILNALRHERGGIVYTKRDDFQQYLYVDEVPFYKFNLVPLSLVPSNEPEIIATEIGKGWVRQEALDLLSYSYSETPSGHFSISGNLDFSEIEELVRISYQALCRGLEERSRQIIKKRGWHEKVAASNQETQRTRYPSRPPRYPEPWRQPYARYPGEHTFHRSRSRDRNRPSSPTPPRTGANVGPLQRAPPSNANSESRQFIRAERTPTDGVKSVVAVTPSPEVRFTLPHMESAQHTRTAGAPPPPPPNPKPAEKPAVIVGRKGKLELELQEATEKLSLLQKRRDVAARTKDHTLKSDLEYYAIPDMKARIEKLKQELSPWVDDYQKKRDGETSIATASASASTGAEKGQTRHNAEMQTDSESSSEEDEPDESEAIMDIYD